MSAPTDVRETHQGRHVQRVAFEHGLQQPIRLFVVAGTPFQVERLEHVEADVQGIELACLLDHLERFAPPGHALEKNRSQSFVAARIVRSEFESPPHVRVGFGGVEMKVQVAALDIGLAAHWVQVDRFVEQAHRADPLLPESVREFPGFLLFGLKDLGARQEHIGR